PDRGVLCSQTAHPLPHGRSVLDHHQSALPKSAFSEEAIDPRSLEEQAEESRQAARHQLTGSCSGDNGIRAFRWLSFGQKSVLSKGQCFFRHFFNWS
ncbi:hypothetical protein Celaphus_00016241, partial [Cervus elaphus hippelaphus]